MAKMQPKPEEMYSLMIDNMPDHMSEKAIKKMFAIYGEIGDIFIPTNDNGTRKKYLFVRYLTKKDQQKAQGRLNGTDINGQFLNVKIVKNRNEAPVRRASNKFVTGFQQDRYLKTIKRNDDQLRAAREELERRSKMDKYSFDVKTVEYFDLNKNKNGEKYRGDTTQVWGRKRRIDTEEDKMLVGPPAPKYLSKSVPKTSSSLEPGSSDSFSSTFSSTSSKFTFQPIITYPIITYPPIPTKLQTAVYRSKEPISRPATICSLETEPRKSAYHELVNSPIKRVIPRKIDTKRAGMFNCDDLIPKKKLKTMKQKIKSGFEEKSENYSVQAPSRPKLRENFIKNDKMRRDVEILLKTGNQESTVKREKKNNKTLVMNQLAEIKQIQHKRKEYHESRERAARVPSPPIRSTIDDFYKLENM